METFTLKKDLEQKFIILNESSKYIKKYFKIYQHLARHFKYNGWCLSSPPPFVFSEIITSFSNYLTNQETGLSF